MTTATAPTLDQRRHTSGRLVTISIAGSVAIPARVRRIKLFCGPYVVGQIVAGGTIGGKLWLRGRISATDRGDDTLILIGDGTADRGHLIVDTRAGELIGVDLAVVDGPAHVAIDQTTIDRRNRPAARRAALARLAVLSH